MTSGSRENSNECNAMVAALYNVRPGNHKLPKSELVFGGVATATCSGSSQDRLGALDRKFPWRDVLIQSKEVIWVIVGLDRDHPLPAFVVGLGHTFLLIAAHEIYVHARLHRRPKAVKDSTDPGNVAGISRSVGPVRQQIHDERRAAIAECG